MVIGYVPIYSKNGQRGYFDYCGCIFPEGIGNDDTIPFNNEDVANVLFKGYKSPEFNNFSELVKKQVKTLQLPRLSMVSHDTEDPVKKLLKERGMA